MANRLKERNPDPRRAQMGRCQSCGKWLRLAKDGGVYAHYLNGVGYCVGGMKPPKALDAPAAQPPPEEK